MKNTIKHKLFGMSALFIFGAIPCVANAFTAIAWSQSGQSGGSVKNAPTKDAAISAAIADCKKMAADRIAKCSRYLMNPVSSRFMAPAPRPAASQQ